MRRIRVHPLLAVVIALGVLAILWVVVRGIILVTGAGTDVDGTVSTVP